MARDGAALSDGPGRMSHTPGERLYLYDDQVLGVRGNKNVDAVERHVARYDKAIAAAGRTGGIWLDFACGSGYGTELISRVARRVVGMDRAEEAQTLDQIDLNMALALVIGHEGSGLRRLVRDNCDFLLKLPMRGLVDSLNAATAGAIILYLAWQARGFEGAKSTD